MQQTMPHAVSPIILNYWPMNAEVKNFSGKCAGWGASMKWTGYHPRLRSFGTDRNRVLEMFLFRTLCSFGNSFIKGHVMVFRSDLSFTLLEVRRNSCWNGQTSAPQIICGNIPFTINGYVFSTPPLSKALPTRFRRWMWVELCLTQRLCFHVDPSIAELELRHLCSFVSHTQGCEICSLHFTQQQSFSQKTLADLMFDPECYAMRLWGTYLQSLWRGHSGRWLCIELLGVLPDFLTIFLKQRKFPVFLCALNMYLDKLGYWVTWCHSQE